MSRNGHVWTRQDSFALMRMHCAGWSARKISLHLDRSPGAILSRLEHMAVERGDPYMDWLARCRIATEVYRKLNPGRLATPPTRYPKLNGVPDFRPRVAITGDARP